MSTKKKIQQVFKNQKSLEFFNSITGSWESVVTALHILKLDHDKPRLSQPPEVPVSEEGAHKDTVRHGRSHGAYLPSFPSRDPEPGNKLLVRKKRDRGDTA